jgi:hypothetical protein
MSILQEQKSTEHPEASSGTAEILAKHTPNLHEA